MSTKSFLTEQEAADAWNQRAGITELQAENAKIRGALKNLIRASSEVDLSPWLDKNYGHWKVSDAVFSEHRRMLNEAIEALKETK